MCDCEHINDSFVREFPIPTVWDGPDWRVLSAELMRDITANATRKVIWTKQGHKIEYDEINAVGSRTIIDQIDVALATVYRLSQEELDFVLNYDRKYREGIEADLDGDEMLPVAAS